MKIKPEPKVVYTYLEPTSKEEKEKAQRKLNKAYDTLFKEVEKTIARKGEKA